MESPELNSKLRPPHGPNPEVVSLRTQFVSSGHTKRLLAETGMMTMHIHCYGPKGGENGLHAHTEEDHIFVCLQGEALFSGLDGPVPPLKKNQAIFLPRGCFYSFSNETNEPCVLLRFGAGLKGYVSERIDPDGEPIAGRAKQAGALKPVPIEGAFFE